MQSDYLYLLISFSYIAILVAIGFLLYRYLRVSSEGVRKFIHIMTSLWIFIVEYKIDNIYLKLLGPFLFIFINGAFSFSSFSSLLGMNDRRRDNGLIYYPLSIFFLVLLEHFGVLSRSSVIAGVLAMGFGDGLAALIGTKFGKNSYLVYGKYKKSKEGTATMFIVSLAVLLLFTELPLYYALLVALVAAFFENMTPLGLDNLSVPFSVAILTEVLCSL